MTLPAGARCELKAPAFAFSHRLSGHPAFAVEAVAQLLEKVPRPWSLHQSGDRELVTPISPLVSVDLPLGDVVRNLEQTCYWLVTRHLELVRPYRELLTEVVEETVSSVPPQEGRMLDRGAMLVLGSPNAVVSAHLDRHHNFLLQLEGTKEFKVGWFGRRRMQGAMVGRNFGRPPSNPDRLPDHHVSFRLGPGQGVYIPPYAFHWASGGPERSVALSCAFRTESTERAEAVQEVNAALRRRGIPSRTPPGSAADGLKLSAAGLYRRRRTRGAAA